MRFIILFLLTALVQASPLLIAHRGASERAPENTLAAFKLAWEEGADGIEADFWLSKDGQIVCIHDENTKKVAKTNLTIASTNAADLRRLDVGSWKNAGFANERIPLLGEVLAILPEGKYFFLEIKCGPEIIQPLKKALASADPRRVIIISFNAKVIQSCRESIPRFEAHLISGLDKISTAGAKEALFAQLEAIDASGLQFNYKAKVDQAFVRELSSKAYRTACWTVNDPRVAAKVAWFGVDFITTDRPGALRKQTDWP